ncbi:MAG: hypothetical protein GC161_06560 [Planctomycetaceae bacterium]|nr:hypothetical protein [Planctomycetaceae bacterium]
MGRANLRLIVATLLVALLLAVAYVQFAPSEPVEELAVDPPAPTAAPVAVAVARSASELRSAVQEDAGDARTPVAEVAESPIPEPLAPGYARGTVVVVDSAGREHTGLNGELRLLPQMDSSGGPQLVPILGGRFEVEISSEGGRVVVGALLADRAASVLAGTAWLEAREQPYELRMGWLQPLLLEVRDADTGQHLSGVELWDTDPLDLDPPRIPAAALGIGPAPRTPLLGPLTSPFPLESWPPGVYRDGMELRVWAPGYSWGALSADPFSGGVRRLELKAAASLEVHFTGAPPPRLPQKDTMFGRERVFLIVARDADMSGGRPANSVLAAPELLHNEPLLIDGLPREPITVLVAVGGAWFHLTTTLARAQVDLGLDPPHRVQLHIASEELVLTPIDGRLHFPPGSTERHWVEVFPVGSPELGLREPLAVGLAILSGSVGEPSTADFSTNSPGPGPHAFVLGDAGYTIVLDVPVGGATNLSLSLPPPAEVTVLAMDLESGGAPTGSAVRYSWVPPDDLPTPRRYARASLDPETASVTIHPPPGRVEFSLDVPGRIGERAVLDLTSGYRTELQLRASPQAHLLLTLRDGDTRIPVPSLSFAHFEDAQGTRVPAAARPHAGGVLYTLPPGDYRLTIPDPPPGYVPIEPTAVHLLAGETEERTLPLRPIR